MIEDNGRELQLDLETMPLIRTLAASLRHEIPKIKGSRFFASLDRIDSSEAAMAFVLRLRREFPSATHHCFAWRLDSTDRGFRYSDDGEPNGTAGRPILREIEGRQLEQVVVVVTRFYGGTRLGTGGLQRAYSTATAEALDRAEILELPIVQSMTIHFAYSLSGIVEGVLSSYSLKPDHTSYGERVSLKLSVPVERYEEFKDVLHEKASGRILIA